jgi:hypothetical protein
MASCTYKGTDGYHGMGNERRHASINDYDWQFMAASLAPSRSMGIGQ